METGKGQVAVQREKIDKVLTYQREHEKKKIPFVGYRAGWALVGEDVCVSVVPLATLAIDTLGILVKLVCEPV